MVLESAQMLSTAILSQGGDAPYKSTHVNHPCNVWVRATNKNYLWLLGHFKALCAEYTRRYGKTHKCYSHLTIFENGVKFIPIGQLTEFQNCAANKSLGISYKHVPDVHTAYMLYLNDRWNNDKIEPRWS